MSNHEPKRKLVGPWQSLHGVIWLVGIYILARNDWWWPGILILVAISALYEGFAQRYMPRAYEEQVSVAPPNQQVTIQPDAAQSIPMAPVSEHRLELLPQVCPSCNAPIRGHEVKWTGAQSANCPYCGTNLPMNKT